MDEYYEPWTYRYGDLFSAPHGESQPAARPVSLVTGKPMDIEAGPNWDDDLGGSPLYAKNDPNLKGVSEEEQRLLHEVERNVYFYIPRICNHCLNPAAWLPALPAPRTSAPSTSGARTASFSSIPRSAVPGACASRDAHTRRSTTTGPRANRRSASSATRGRRQGRSLPASTYASAASATWASCSTMRTG